MKNILLTLILSLLTTQFLMAQNETRMAAKLKEMNNDTIRYIREYIVDRKDFYIGKPFDSLFRDMPLPLRGCVNEMNTQNRFISAFTIFYFYNYWGKNNHARLLITWNSLLDKRDIDRLGSSTIGGKWTQSNYDYYKNKTIKNVKILEPLSL